MKITILRNGFLLFPLITGLSLADDVEPTDYHQEMDSAPAIGDLFGPEPSIGGFLFPSLHIFSVFGDTTGEQSDLAVNDHDPQREATLQGIEPGVSLRAGNLQGFAVGTGLTDANGDFSFTLEEGFLKLVELPLGLELRGGQYLNRMGFQNAVHNHGWSFVDQTLVNGRFLNEGELLSQGGEVSWNVPLNMMQASVLSVSVGGLASHSHGHSEEEHEEEAEFEAEGANFVDQVVTANWVNQYDINDMNRVTGIVAGAWGDNEFGRTSQVYSAGVEYLWRENGYGSGGRSLSWRTEAMVRSVEARSGHLHGEEEHGEHEEDHHDEHGEEGHDEHDHDAHDDHDEDHHDEHGEGEEDHDDEIRYANFNEFGAYSQLIYGFNDQLEAGVRAEWVSGISEFGLDNRWRVSPMVTFYANPERNLQARLQYNYDHSNDFGSEHSVWFQVGLSFGSGEVR